MQHYPLVTPEVINTWSNDEVMRTLIAISNEAYFVGYMVNDDDRAYGVRYAGNLPDACRIALKWAESEVDQSSRIWSQWTTAEV